MGRVIGWREHVDLPDAGIRLVAKMDTGAYSSTLHAEAVEALPGRRVRFRIPQAPDGTDWITTTAPLVDWRWVKDSGGHSSMRPVIRMRFTLAGEQWEEDVTLFDRSGMKHRLLLGRRALRGRFIVDPCLSHAAEAVAVAASAA